MGKKLSYLIGITMVAPFLSAVGYHFIPRKIQATVQSSGLMPNVQVSPLGTMPKKFDRARGRMVDDPLSYIGELDYLIITDKGSFETSNTNLGSSVESGKSYKFLVNQWFNPLLGKFGYEEHLNIVSVKEVEN